VTSNRKPIQVPEKSPRRVGVVSSAKRDKTRTVVIPYMGKHPKYGKYVRKRTVLHVHDEKNESRPGDRVDYQAVDAAAEIYANLPKQLGTRVTEVAFLPGKGVRVTTETGQVGLLGDSSSIPYKLASWAAVERKAADRGIAYNTIDLRFGNRPVVQ
jgi:ribosomal protein S17